MAPAFALACTHPSRYIRRLPATFLPRLIEKPVVSEPRAALCQAAMSIASVVLSGVAPELGGAVDPWR